jgi:diguanylate cyclase (GGDEF)-like protein
VNRGHIVVALAVRAEADRALLADLLEAAGYRVASAKESPVDLAIASGADDVARLVATLGTDVPVVALVEDSSGGQAALERGAIDFIRLPIDAVEVRARVASAARLRAVRARLDEAVRTDLLTGLANRRHVAEHFEMTAGATRRHRTLMGVLMVDVDHLRRINDEHGHAAGDAVLRAIAERLTAVLRIEDMAGRWGGEEFLVVLPSTGIDGAWQLAERVREAISASPVPLQGADIAGLVVTVSIGCAEGYGDDLDDHLRRAELALMDAKSTGRNRTMRDTTFAV